MKKHTGKVLDKVDGYKVIECRICKFRHVQPVPSEEELNKLYSDTYYAREKPRYLKEAEEDYQWWMATYRYYYDLFTKYTKGRRLLDIGSGPGYFLKCGKDLGWNVLGFEPSKQAYEYSTKKLRVRVINDFFTKDYIKKIGKFDVIYLSFILEHLPDPRNLIKIIRKILRPNGIIAIISPNDYNPLQMILKNNLKYKPWWVVPLQHINYFDFNSTKNFLKRLGFEISEMQATFPMEFFLLSGDNYVGNNKIGRKCHAKRMQFEMNLLKYNPQILHNFYNSLAENNIGREFVIIARLRK